MIKNQILLTFFFMAFFSLFTAPSIACENHQSGNKPAQTKSVEGFKAHEAMQNLYLSVEGMTCGGCAANIQKTLKDRKGVVNAVASFKEQKVAVSFDAKTVSAKEIMDQISKLGYKVQEISDPKI